MAPGILYVTMQPKPSLSSSEFHDWYNNEHGPNRLRLPFVQNGFRYKATDLDGPGKGLHEWMAIYDITDMDELNNDAYMALRGAPVQTQRERDIRPSVDIDRRSYDFIREWKNDDYKTLENVDAEKGNVMVSVSFRLKPGQKSEELDKWYNEEHVGMLQKVPGWRRTRRYKTSTIDKLDETEYLALHEYAPQNGLDGEEFKAATSTEWTNRINTTVCSEKKRRVYELFYTFGAAPRQLSKVATWDSPATKTKTYPSSVGHSVVESYITTKDGAELHFKLEGSSDPDAPVIVLSNSILVDYGIWDNFVKAFFSSSQNKKYRVLRYLTRGRTSSYGTEPITVDLLAADIISLLDTLRIQKAAAVAGVSLGGATVLNVALRYPDRINAFLSCDTNAKSPEGNSKAWGERITMAEKTGATSSASQNKGEKIVGEDLAEITVRRWFVKETYDGGEMEKEAERIKQMVVNNSLDGFANSVKALWQYDMTPLMKGCKVKGAYLVGAGDGVLPAGMKKMAEETGDKGVECHVIEGAGHLPMVEKPEEVADVVSKLVN